jgi:hypothetical protein
MKWSGRDKGASEYAKMAGERLRINEPGREEADEMTDERPADKSDQYVYVVKEERWGSCETLEIFSTREKAEAFIGGVTTDLIIEERELDPEDYRVVRYYWVDVDFETGRKLSEGTSHAIRPNDWTHEVSLLTHYLGHRHDIIEAFSAISHKHAVEIVVAYKEKRSRARAKVREQIGIDGSARDLLAGEYPGF